MREIIHIILEGEIKELIGELKEMREIKERIGEKGYNLMTRKFYKRKYEIMNNCNKIN